MALGEGFMNEQNENKPRILDVIKKARSGDTQSTMDLIHVIQRWTDKISIPFIALGMFKASRDRMEGELPEIREELGIPTPQKTGLASRAREFLSRLAKPKGPKLPPRVK